MRHLSSPNPEELIQCFIIWKIVVICHFVAFIETLVKMWAAYPNSQTLVSRNLLYDFVESPVIIRFWTFLTLPIPIEGKTRKNRPN